MSLAPAGHARADARGEAEAWLAGRIAGLASDARVTPARVGVAVMDLASGRVVTSLRSAEAFNVASNVKLVTAAAALSVLGPEFRPKTVLFGPAPTGPTIEGDVYLKGFGDPSLGEADLWQMASDLYDRGVRRVEGGIVVDESYFDTVRMPPLFSEKDTDQWYRAPTGALSLNQNVVSVQVEGATVAGETARAVLRPSSSYLRLVNNAITTSGLRRSWVTIHTRSDKTSTVVEVGGRVRIGYRGRRFRRRIEDPGLLAGTTFLDLLTRRGIRVGRTKVSRGKAPAGSVPLVTHTSRPLSILIHSMTKQSSNFVAEQILKVMGAEVMGEPGTWDKGLRMASSYLASLHIPHGSYTMKNGSGLYDSNRFTPDQLVRVIRDAATNFKHGNEFLAALALAGVDGTLAHRFVGTGAERYVRGKTGTLSTVVTLAGVAGSSARRSALAFAICINGLPKGKVVAARAVVDEMAAALVTYLEK
jgi:D-alanyl-D-alanine carboxypeptidase/D-alanyl-D-alanine-endopeptidase (penicillin-binding protein 4)